MFEKPDAPPIQTTPGFPWLSFFGSVLIAIAGPGMTVAQETEPVIVEANRLPDVSANAPFSVDVVTREQLDDAPQLRLDDILRNQVPGFSLFRRSSSRVANPTTQGVTLRNFGPSGAGRTLVLLDGIPVNDPFAGYVLWNQLPPSSLDTVLVSPGGGAGLFGNAALAGTIFLVSDRPTIDSLTSEMSAGNADTFDTSARGTLVRPPVSLSVFAERFSTGGYPVLRAGQRGPVDNSASADSDLIRIDSDFALTSVTSLRVSGDLFREERGNGTIYTTNETRGADASAVLKARFPQVDGDLQLGAYYQARKYRSTFSSVNAARDLETPALDQYDVPADAAGGSAVWSMVLGGQHRITLGSDLRFVKGETNELFRFIDGDFTRRRSAGGSQLFLGAFAEDTWTPVAPVTVVGSIRADHWSLYDGFRDEFDRATDARTLGSRFGDREGDSINERLGIRLDLTSRLSIRTAAYTGFRVPTLNELYRPFRVGNDVTEANADLKPERLLGGELGLEWRPTGAIRLAGTAFLNRLEDAVGNVTIGVGPGNFTPGGFIPSGGVLRQRQNLDLIIAPGFELTGEWTPIPSLRFRGSYLWTDPTIQRAADPALVGRLLAQTPQHTITTAIEWNFTAKWLIAVQARYVARQFEDDLNSRTLAPFTTIDATASYEFSRNLSAALKVENLLDSEIETGKSATGLTSIGAPRLVTSGSRAALIFRGRSRFSCGSIRHQPFDVAAAAVATPHGFEP